MTRREREAEKRSKREIAKKGAVKVAKMLQFPETALSKSAQMEIMGNREITVDGSQGVLEYSEDCIKINAGRMVLKFSGRGLTLKCLSGESLAIEGFLTGIEFLT